MTRKGFLSRFKERSECKDDHEVEAESLYELFSSHLGRKVEAYSS